MTNPPWIAPVAIQAECPQCNFDLAQKPTAPGPACAAPAAAATFDLRQGLSPAAAI
jgi:hypothetical protein